MSGTGEWHTVPKKKGRSRHASLNGLSRKQGRSLGSQPEANTKHPAQTGKNKSTCKPYGNKSQQKEGRSRVYKGLPKLNDCNGVAELLDIFRDCSENLKPNDISLFWSKIAKLVTANIKERYSLRSNETTLTDLLLKTQENAQLFEPKPLAITVHGLAKIQSLTGWDTGPAIWDNLQQRVLCVADEFSPWDLSNVAWGFSKIGCESLKLFGRLANVAEPQLHKFNPQGLANMAWAYAMVGHEAPSLFDKIATASAKKLDEFDPQSLANMAWAFATAGHKAPMLFDEIAMVPAKKLDEFKPQQLANTAWAFATAGHKASSLFNKIATVSAKKIGMFKPQELANIAWAFATVRQEAPALFDEIAMLPAKKLDEFNPQELANMAWAFATVGHKAPSLFDELATVSAKKLNEFNPQNLANMAWAFATVGHKAPSLFEEIAKVSAKKLDEFNPQGLANVAWAFATVRQEAPSLLDEIAKVSAKKMGVFKPQELANVAWAFATAGHEARTLFDEIATASAKKLDDFNPQDLANMAWAFAVLDHCCEAFLRAAASFAGLCEANASLFSVEALRQLYQWQLWCQEKGAVSQLPADLHRKCRDAFIKDQGKRSELQQDICATLVKLKLEPEEEVRTRVGYSLDAVVTFRGNKVGIEVDGPRHFINRSPTGATVLKHRQLLKLENWCLVSVPYWEWDALESKDRDCKSGRKWRKQYLFKQLTSAVAKYEAADK